MKVDTRVAPVAIADQAAARDRATDTIHYVRPIAFFAPYANIPNMPIAL